MNCPHCNKSQVDNQQLVIAETNCENYGSGEYTIQCTECDKLFGVYATRKAHLSTPFKTLCKDIDFPQS